MLVIDGSQGEGGGQILRTSLALSLVTGKPFRIERIRARRPRPGVMRQHLTAIRAAALVGGAAVEGDVLGSLALTFRPRRAVAGGELAFDVGTAGSTTLVLETLLPALLVADSRSMLSLAGGTHNPLAPPFEFLERSFLPLVTRMGARVEVALARPGFYPAGGGLMIATIEPIARLAPLDLGERGTFLGGEVTAVVAHLPTSIAERELRVIRQRLGWPAERFRVQQVSESAGPGNVVLVELRSQHVTEIVSSFGMRGVPAETVALRALADVERYLASDAPVGEHLADQLLLPLALAGEGCFRTLPPSGHTRTNAAVVQRFLEVDLTFRPHADGSWEVRAAR